MIDLHWAEGCLMMGRMLFILRRYLPRIYDKKVRYTDKMVEIQIWNVYWYME